MKPYTTLQPCPIAEKILLKDYGRQSLCGGCFSASFALKEGNPIREPSPIVLPSFFFKPIDELAIKKTVIPAFENNSSLAAKFCHSRVFTPGDMFTSGNPSYPCNHIPSLKQKITNIPQQNIHHLSLSIVQVTGELHEMYYVYIITNQRKGTLYVGVTNNLRRRMQEHRKRSIPGFTSDNGLVKLVYYETGQDIKEAITREKRIKKWRRQWKLQLIEKTNPEWRDLYVPIR